MQSVNFSYAANGIKLRKQTKIDHQLSATWDYSGRFIYADNNGDNTQLAYLMANHGRIVMHEDGSSSYEYSLKDHLGNTRITFDEDLNIIQEDAYYPYGMNIKGLSYNNSCSENKYKYNGKEHQEDFGLNCYDFETRFYDASLTMTLSMDPLLEKYHPISPYRMFANNPVRYTDPTGMDIDPASQEEFERQRRFLEKLVGRLTNKLHTEKNSEKKKERLNKRIFRLKVSLKHMDDMEATEEQTFVLTPMEGSVNGKAGTLELLEDNKINVIYTNAAVLIHEVTHVKQFMEGEIAFFKSSGLAFLVDLKNEVEAYRAQFNVSPVSVQNIQSYGIANKYELITRSWVKNIDDGSFYGPNGKANTAQYPLDIYSKREDWLKAYPNNKALQNLPSNESIVKGDTYGDYYYQD